MMMKEHCALYTSVFDFKDEDTKTYWRTEGKKNLFYTAFAPKRTRPAKKPKLSVVTGKRLNTSSSRKRGSQRKMTTRDMCQQNATSQKARGNLSSSGSDKIETDNSDSDQDRDMLRQSYLRTGGDFGALRGSFETCKDEEFVAEKDREVAIIGEQLLLLGDIYISSPEFTFTADTIVLKIRDANLECIIKWPLQEIEIFRSCAHQEAGPALIELDLTESGVEALREKLEGSLRFNNDYSCRTISSLISKVGVSWSEQERQITSLSDGYKSVWRPGKEEMIEQFRRDLERINWERHRASLDDWLDIVFPKEDHDAVTVTKYDYLLLNPDEFVSDTIIDFYIKYLQSLLPEHKKERFYFFNSFFFRKLTEIDKNLQHGLEKCKSSFERVKRWTARVNIFDKDYLFIPIMQGAHWSLVIVCHPGYLSAGCQDSCNLKAPVILHFDSLEGCHTGVEQPIRNYLVEAWSQKNEYCEDSGRIAAIKFVAAKVPQQTNYSDCGLFLLHYVELFINEVLNGNSTDFVTGEWFNPADASEKRAKIQWVIKCLQDEKLAGRGKNPQYYTASSVMVSTDGALLAQRSAELGDKDPNFVFGATNKLDLVHGNLSDQTDTFDPDPLHHESQMQMQMQDFSEAGLDFMYSAVPCQLCHSLSLSQLQGPCSERFMVCHGCREEPVNDSPEYATAEEAANGLSEYTILNENSMDHHAHEREVANDSPGYTFVEEGGNDLKDSNMAEKSSSIIDSDFFVNINPSMRKSEPEFAYRNIFQHPYDRQVLDGGNTAMQNCLDEMWSASGADEFNQSQSDRKQTMDREVYNLVEQVVDTAESSCLVEKMNTQLREGTVKASNGSSESRQCLFGSIGAANDQLEDKDIILMDSGEIETLHNEDNSCQAIDEESITSVVANDQLKDEVAVVVESGEGESLQDENDTCKAIIIEGAVPSLRELECESPHKTSDTSPPRKGDTSFLANPHNIPSNEELSTPYNTKFDKARKTGQRNCRRNAQEDSELVWSHVGPVTRSTSKRTKRNSERRGSYLLQRKKN